MQAGEYRPHGCAAALHSGGSAPLRGGAATAVTTTELARASTSKTPQDACCSTEIMRRGRPAGPPRPHTGPAHPRLLYTAVYKDLLSVRHNEKDECALRSCKGNSPSGASGATVSERQIPVLVRQIPVPVGSYSYRPSTRISYSVRVRERVSYTDLDEDLYQYRLKYAETTVLR
eukprot:COSAG05_NODE_313_length_11620_cov_2.287301_6_plen_174_part_00